jgi:hypothetical protein
MGYASHSACYFDRRDLGVSAIPRTMQCPSIPRVHQALFENNGVVCIGYEESTSSVGRTSSRFEPRAIISRVAISKSLLRRILPMEVWVSCFGRLANLGGGAKADFKKPSRTARMEESQVGILIIRRICQLRQFCAAIMTCPQYFRIRAK